MKPKTGEHLHSGSVLLLSYLHVYTPVHVTVMRHRYICCLDGGIVRILHTFEIVHVYRERISTLVAAAVTYLLLLLLLLVLTMEPYFGWPRTENNMGKFSLLIAQLICSRG